MNKAEFLHEIEKRIVALPEEERWRSIDFFSEMIDERLEEGVSEDEAVASIGSPDEVAENILQEVPVRQEIGERESKHQLDITQEFGSVHITEINRGVKLVLSKDGICHVNYEDIPGMNTTVTVQGGSLHIETQDNRRWYDKIKGIFKDGGEMNVYLPERVYDELHVRCVNGDLKFKGLKVKSIHTGTTNGDVELDKVTAEVIHISTTNGDVDIKGDMKELHVSTVNGDIDGVLTSGKVFHAKTVTGDVKVPENDVSGGEAHLTTVNGDIKIKVKG